MLSYANKQARNKWLNISTLFVSDKFTKKKAYFCHVWILGALCSICLKIRQPKYIELFTGYTGRSPDGLSYYTLLIYEVNMILYN